MIRAYLHAAALDGRSIVDVVSWAARPGDTEPIRILRSTPAAAPGWADDLASQAATDPRTRDGIWAGVRRAFDCFADPRVLAACSPRPDEAFDPDAFLENKGTLYVVGSTGAQLSVAPLITAMIEDLAERALGLAARSDHGRLDPPLALFLDEVANIAPLTSLPSLLSAGGGSGICTLIVLQSLAQARARWGTDRADAIWDASTVRVVLGGLGHADDLTRISRLAGEIDEEVGSASRGAGGQTWSTSLRSRPVLPLERIRSLASGRALVLHRRTPPIEAVLQPWWERSCADEVRRSLAHLGSVGRGAHRRRSERCRRRHDRGAEPIRRNGRAVSSSTIPWNWQKLDRKAAKASWKAVAEFVDWLVARFDLGDVIPACWWAHGAIVEELTALWAAWLAAYDHDESEANGPIDWMEHLATCRTRLVEWDRMGCAQRGHRDGSPANWTIDNAAFVAFVDADLDHRPGTEELHLEPPVPKETEEHGESDGRPC